MANTTINAPRDGNFVPAAQFAVSGNTTAVQPGQIDSLTGRVLVDNAGGGSGTVTSVSVVTAQGVSGSVATATTTPAITLTLGALTGVTSFNGLVVTANTGAITTGSWAATAIPMTKGGTGADLSAIAKGGLITGTGAGTVGITTVGADGTVLSADAASAGGVKWIAAGGTGTVTTVSVATANGFSGTVANATTTPAITIIAGAITPTSVNGLTITTTTGTFTLTNAKTLTVSDSTTLANASVGFANGKTLTVSNSLTLAGTDGKGINVGAATSGKILVGDGSNMVLSTPTFPNASATSGKIIKSDGTNWVASTETYAAPSTSGNVMTSDGTNWTSAAPAAGGSSYWTAVPGSPTRTANTTFTVTDTGNANSYNLLLSRGTVLKWTESSTVRMAMITVSSYSANVVTVTIMGDTMASIDASSLKYAAVKVRSARFSIAGTIGTGNDLAGRFWPEGLLHVFGADGHHGTAGTTNATTYTLSQNSTSGGGTILASAVSIASGATAGDGQTATSGTTITLDDYIALNVTAVSTTAPIDAYISMYYNFDNEKYLS